MIQFRHRFVVGCALLVSGIIGFGSTSTASEKAVKMKDLPAAVRSTVLEQTRGAKLRGLSKETENGKTFYEAETLVNGLTRDILIDSNGAVVEIEEQVGIDSLPKPVRAEIESRADKILKVESVTKNGALAFYEARIQKKGKRTEIQISPEGKLLTTKQ
ncbi:MAG: hypothetical protein DMF61_22705 [Blastocatellia bacterium AA13]|nr:MAG: hypothetical protein DMF61_22705 [Blastocatellia bacterium AA13]